MNELEGRLSEKEGDAAGIAGIGSVYIRTYPGFLPPSRPYISQGGNKSHLDQIYKCLR